MKIVFSEYISNYSNYQFPYCIWALEESSDAKSDILSKGFLPSGNNPLRYYLCRSLRVSCNDFYLSSENKRVLSKNGKLKIELVKKDNIIIDNYVINMCLESAKLRFDNNVMTCERLEALFESSHTSHFLIFMNDKGTGDAGKVTTKNGYT